MKRILPILTGTVFLLGLASSARAVPVQWTTGSGGNGHFYEVIFGAINWTNARAAAAASTHLGQQGYLASVTSAAEQAFLNTLNPFNRIAWLGGTDQAAEGAWVWVDGPENGQQFWAGSQFGTTTAPFNYANWNSGEPNDAGSGEDGLAGWWSADRWNDFPTANNVGAYVVEFNAPSLAVSEPAMLGLFGIALAGIGLARRRRNA